MAKSPFEELLETLKKSIQDLPGSISSSMNHVLNELKIAGGLKKPKDQEVLVTPSNPLADSFTKLIPIISKYRDEMGRVVGYLERQRTLQELASRVKGSPSSVDGSDIKATISSLQRDPRLTQAYRSELKERVDEYRKAKEDESKASREEISSLQRLGKETDKEKAKRDQYATARREYIDVVNREGVAHPYTAEAKKKLDASLNEQRKADRYRKAALSKYRTLARTPWTTVKERQEAYKQYKMYREKSKRASQRVAARQATYNKYAGRTNPNVVAAGKKANKALAGYRNQRNRRASAASAAASATRNAAAAASRVGRARAALASSTAKGLTALSGSMGAINKAAGLVGAISQSIQEVYRATQDLRRQTSGATYDALRKSANFSPEAINASINLGMHDYMRAIKLARQTGGTAAGLAMAENRARDAWLGHDIAMQNIDNRWNAFKAGFSATIGDSFSRLTGNIDKLSQAMGGSSQSSEKLGQWAGQVFKWGTPLGIAAEGADYAMSVVSKALGIDMTKQEKPQNQQNPIGMILEAYTQKIANGGITLPNRQRVLWNKPR